MLIHSKRIYDGYHSTDGYRVLVDRLWPRGIKKEEAHIDLWAKDVTPSTELRKWFHANREKYPSFVNKYKKELSNNPTMPSFIQNLEKHDTATFITSVKDVEHSHVPVLIDYVMQHLQ